VHHDPPSCGDNAGKSQRTEQSQGKVTGRSQHLRGVVSADATRILTERHVTDVVQPVLDSPVASVQREQPLGVGSLGFEACDPVGHLDAVFPLFPPLASDLANLL
jgi:hypothetical protein